MREAGNFGLLCKFPEGPQWREVKSVEGNCGGREIYKWNWVISSNLGGSFSRSLVHHTGKWANHVSGWRTLLGALCGVSSPAFLLPLSVVVSRLSGGEEEVRAERVVLRLWVTGKCSWLWCSFLCLLPSETIWGKNILYLCYLLMTTNEIRASYWLKSEEFLVLTINDLEIDVIPSSVLQERSYSCNLEWNHV